MKRYIKQTIPEENVSKENKSKCSLYQKAENIKKISILDYMLQICKIDKGVRKLV